MTPLRETARRVLHEWKTDPSSARMASLMMALQDALAEPPRKFTCVYPQCVSTTRTTCDEWASGACEERQP